MHCLITLIFSVSLTHFCSRGSAVFTADIEVDNSDFPNELQDAVALNILDDINEALETPSDELTAIINTNGSGGIIGDPILNSLDILVLDTNYGKAHPVEFNFDSNSN